MVVDDVLGDAELLVNDPLDFSIDLLGGALAVVLAANHFASEENVFVVVAVLDHAELVAHAPVTHHGAGQLGGLLDVPCRAGGDIAGDNLLGDTAGHRDGDHIEHFFAAAVQHVVLGQGHG